MADDAAELERQVRSGAWLRPGQVATLLEISRKTVDRMLHAEPPLLRYRFKPGSGKHREVHPADVVARLDERREVQGDPSPPAPAVEPSSEP